MANTLVSRHKILFGKSHSYLLSFIVRSLAIEWLPKIRTVGIAPGFIDTSGNQKWFDFFVEAERQRTINYHPVKKLGIVEEIGGWRVLASGYAAFSSGVTYLKKCNNS